MTEYNVVMSNVICLQSARLEKQSQAVAYSAGGLDIDFSDVERLYSPAVSGIPELSGTDRIVLGARAQTQVRALFWGYGLRQMPQTWCELEGNWNYCRLLNLWLIAMTPSESDSVLRGLETRHNQRQAGRGDLLRMLMNGDLEGAHAWHTEKDTFWRNASDPKLTAG